MTTAAQGWAAWHPKHGFQGEEAYALVYSSMDDACQHVRELNKDYGTNNRTGWRAVRVIVSRAE